VVARCGPGHPLVIRNRPTDPEGRPFPTLYWLTCPEAVRAVSRLESEGWVRRLGELAQVDPDFGTRLRRAHQAYAGERGRLHPGAEAWGGVGGTARGLKCLHAHFAYHLAGGDDPVGEWVAERVDLLALHYERPARRLAAVDLGTNSVRLLVARFPEGGGPPRELARDMVITRLGQGVDRTGRLDGEAVARTVEVVERYCRRARALRAERVHLAATAAVREAANRDELATAVLRLTGEPMEVLSGEEEAALAFLGATRGLDREPPFLVVDVGGGSTEFVLGDREVRAAASRPIGSVRLTERLVRSDPPAYEELAAVERAVAEALSEVERPVPVREARTLVLVAGTATTTQAIALGLGEYDPERIHRSVLRREDAERVFRLLADMTTEERRKIPVMPPGREDVIVAGAAILVGVMRRWGFTEAVVSETDLLDGIAYRMAEERAEGGRPAR
jgi:exopolyphosphatase/pppGpp-phosphohydrolase